MSGEVEQRQLGEGFLLAEHRRRGRALIDKRVCELLPAQRPAKHNRVELGMHHEKPEALSARLNAGR